MSGSPACVVPAEAIAARVRDLARGIRELCPEGPVTILGVLHGAAFFAPDLVRALEGPAELGFVHARSYGAGTVSSGEVDVGPLEESLLPLGPVVVADTIVDTGRTLRAVVDRVRAAGPSRVLSCVLLDKRARRAVDVEPDLRGFDVQDRFFVGYGLDHAGRHRALPYVGAVGENGGG